MTSLASDTTELSRRYDTPLGVAHGSMDSLKERIKLHYDVASKYYLALWGEHIHHGYWINENDSKEQAQLNLINLIISISNVPEKSSVLDVGCGIGGTSRYLASALSCTVTGITISSKQVEIANQLAQYTEKPAKGSSEASKDGLLHRFEQGKARFLEVDAEKMGCFFRDSETDFDAVWVLEALNHFPNKNIFFQNAFDVLRPGGKLIIADWAKAEDLTDDMFSKYIQPIEDGMLLPPLCTESQYVDHALKVGFKAVVKTRDISDNVSKTWNITWSLVQRPSLWAFALSQGRDGIAFLQSFRAMRKAYANKSFRYLIICFEKPL
ncbi:hypothetical protein ACJZ2D_001783 [Fusarium nematophilum]